MKLKLALGVMAVSIILFLGVSSVFAINAYLDVSPKRIPQDGIVTIYIENKYETEPITVDYINVTHVNSGTIYTKSVGVDLDPGDSISVDFGTGVGGWTPLADTSQEGKYVVEVVGPFNVDGYFNVSDMFSVPELSLPVPLVAAISFVLLFAVRRRANKSKT